MFGNIGGSELVLIFLVTLLVFGAKRLPEIARGVGQGIREFRNATREIQRELDVAAPPRTPDPMPAARTTPQAPVPPAPHQPD